MRFRLKAVGPNNAIVAIDLEAADADGARTLAERRGLAVLSVAPRGIELPHLKARFPATLFTVELRTLLTAGLGLVESLQALAERERDPTRARVLQGLLTSLAEGEPLSRALERFPEAFPDLYVATVRASERTGDLPQALSRYVAYRESMDRVRKQLVASLLYPAILTVAGALVMAFLVFYVVPRFARVYEDATAALPFFSALLLGAGRAIDAHGGVIAATLVACTAGLAWVASRPNIRVRVHALLWRLPAFGERLQAYQLARFYRSTGMLLRAGIPAPQAIGMVASLLEAHLREGLAAALGRIEAGSPISAALAAAGLAPPVALRLLRVGEGGGRMGEMMERVADFLDEENARLLDAFMRIFEPALMALLGLAVGGIVVLMYMPVFELAGSVR